MFFLEKNEPESFIFREKVLTNNQIIGGILNISTSPSNLSPNLIKSSSA